MAVYRVTDYTARRIVYFGTHPQVRKYKLEHPEHEIVEEKCETTYKFQLVKLLNQTLEIRDVFSGVDD